MSIAPNKSDNNRKLSGVMRSYRTTMLHAIFVLADQECSLCERGQTEAADRLRGKREEIIRAGVGIERRFAERMVVTEAVPDFARLDAIAGEAKRLVSWMRTRRDVCDAATGFVQLSREFTTLF